jgi:hypothetical protein
MRKSRLTYLYVGTCLATFFAFANGCAAPTSDNPQGGGGSGGSTSTAGTTGTAGTSPGGTTGTAGSSSAGNTGTAGNGSAGNGTAGSTGGSASGTAGNGSAGNGTAGSTARGGSGGSTTGTAGATGTAGSTARGGSGGTGTAGATGTAGTGGTGVRMDMAGVPLARPGDMQATSKKYLNLGDMRLINNRWGSDELNCTGTQQKVYVNTDKSIGWEFNRPTCGGAKGKPDYPEVEFGVAPFGSTSSLLTTPAFSTTTLLPIQLTSLTSASVTIDTLFISLTKPTYYNINVEFWLSQGNPLTSSNPMVHSEIIAFWGWEANRNNSSAGGWSCGTTEQSKGNITSGSSAYNLCHQSDNWSSGWHFYNFNVNNGPLTAYSGKVDVKAMIDWVISKYAIPNNLWLTRIEVGSEIDDNTQGTVRIKNLTFEINGQNRSIELAP